MFFFSPPYLTFTGGGGVEQIKIPVRKVKGKNRCVKAFLLFLQLKLALNQATKIMKTLKQPGIIIEKL